MSSYSRRRFLEQSIAVGAAAVAAGPWTRLLAAEGAKPGAKMAFGMVTYQWGQNWDVPTLLANLEKAKVLAVELRTEHAHKVQPELNAAERAEVKARFADSPVKLVGLGTNEHFDQVDRAEVEKCIEAAKAFVKLSHDVGGSGVKVKPNDLPKGVPVEKTTEQIGKALNVLGAFAADYGQQIRLEVHGQCSPLPIIKQIIDVADHPNVYLCWNSNQKDLDGEGLERNFNLVKHRLGPTTHVRPLDTPGYPWQQLIDLFVKLDYAGWLLLEAGGTPKGDPVEAIVRQRELFESMVADAQKRM
jgi:sugar phosphate isomerase/epimerase